MKTPEEWLVHHVGAHNLQSMDEIYDCKTDLIKALTDYGKQVQEAQIIIAAEEAERIQDDGRNIHYQDFEATCPRVLL